MPQPALHPFTGRGPCRPLRLWRPAWFQGCRRRRRYFEGWYFKSVSADGTERLAVIPGLSLGRDGGDGHAFVQVLDGARHASHYFRYALRDFAYAPGEFDLAVGPNRFGAGGIVLDLGNGKTWLRGELRFDPLAPWPVRALSPGAMGWYAFAPFMECYHGVLSFHHRVNGGLELDGRGIDFSGGAGYIEKDWGASFPSAWVWLQCNHFQERAASVFASVARIPWLGGAFTGFLAGLWIEGRLHAFATHTGARARLARTSGGVRLVLAGKQERLEIEAVQADSAELSAPRAGLMDGRIAESLNSLLRVRLGDRSGREIFAGEGRWAGLEIAGDVPGLARDLAGRRGLRE